MYIITNYNFMKNLMFAAVAAYFVTATTVTIYWVIKTNKELKDLEEETK